MLYKNVSEQQSCSQLKFINRPHTERDWLWSDCIFLWKCNLSSIWNWRANQEKTPNACKLFTGVVGVCVYVPLCQLKPRKLWCFGLKLCGFVEELLMIKERFSLADLFFFFFCLSKQTNKQPSCFRSGSILFTLCLILPVRSWVESFWGFNIQFWYSFLNLQAGW